MLNQLNKIFNSACYSINEKARQACVYSAIQAPHNSVKGYKNTFKMNT